MAGQMEETIKGISKDSVDSSSPDGDEIIHKQVVPARRSSKGGWTEEEDRMLEFAVKIYGGKNWKSIAKHVSSRTDVQCLHRWQKVLNPSVIKGPWTKEEDELIRELVGKQGLRKWSEVAKHLPGRIGKQCRERWYNHLSPDINKTAWTNEEESTLIKAHGIYGNKWAEITKFLPGRTENSIKNHWNGLVKKTLNLGLPSNTTLSCPKPIRRGLSDSKTNIGSKDPGLFKQHLNSKFSADNTASSENSTETSTIKFPDQGILRTPTMRTSSNQCNDLFSPPRYNPDEFSSELDREDNKWRGLCYQPLMLDDLNIFLETGSFPCTDSYLRHPANVISQQSFSAGSSSSCSSPESILRNAAKTFTTTPSIIRRKSPAGLK